MSEGVDGADTFLGVEIRVDKNFGASKRIYAVDKALAKALGYSNPSKAFICGTRFLDDFTIAIEDDVEGEE